jgi:putative membrane protein insertion efficiency factor
MSNFLIFLIVCIINLYKYLISPILGNKCRYLPTCSDYFIDSLKIHGFSKGLYLGFKRILSCHPIKYLGGSSGLDLVPKKKILSKGKN